MFSLDTGERITSVDEGRNETVTAIWEDINNRHITRKMVYHSYDHLRVSRPA